MFLLFLKEEKCLQIMFSLSSRNECGILFFVTLELVDVKLAEVCFRMIWHASQIMTRGPGIPGPHVTFGSQSIPGIPRPQIFL